MMGAIILKCSVVGRVKLDSKKMEQLLGRQPKLNKFPFPFYIFFLVTFDFVFS